MVNKKTLALIILDGWGYSENQEGNAIYLASTPNMDNLLKNAPHTFILPSGEDVGLPKGQMGNSEVGHINIGAGRIVYQDYTRISKSIDEGEFEKNSVFLNALSLAKQKSVHIIGLLSDGGVHSHQKHIEAITLMAAKHNIQNIYLHCILDGRDTPPKSAVHYLEQLNQCIAPYKNIKIATMMGRFYAMDRDNRWERVALAYNAIVSAEGQTFHHAIDCIQSSYENNETDEFILPKINSDYPGVEDDDVVFFMNFRADRARELTRPFIEKDFNEFIRSKNVSLSDFVMLTEFSQEFQASCAFAPIELTNTLGEVLASNHKSQLRISETEKYAHVTFFFNGGQETTFKDEKRILIPSPKVKTYDLQPEMNSVLLTDTLINNIVSQEFDVIICNYPNADMVGHSGDIEATIKACEAVDTSVGRIIQAIKEIGGTCLITADHGNAEKMCNHTTGQPHTSHTTTPVPFIYIGTEAVSLRSGGRLSDIAPTILTLLKLSIPQEMTGKSIINLKT